LIRTRAPSARRRWLKKINKTLFAQRELAREAAAKKKFAEEEEKKRQEEEAEKQKERKQLEEIVAAQTKVLEEKLTQLASTMTPKPGATGVIDPESTQIQRAGMTTGGDVSFPGTSAIRFRAWTSVWRRRRVRCYRSCWWCCWFY
jgi:hypothetical protein